MLQLLYDSLMTKLSTPPFLKFFKNLKETYYFPYCKTDLVKGYSSKTVNSPGKHLLLINCRATSWLRKLNDQSLKILH